MRPGCATEALSSRSVPGARQVGPRRLLPGLLSTDKQSLRRLAFVRLLSAVERAAERGVAVAGAAGTLSPKEVRYGRAAPDTADAPHDRAPP